MRAKTRTAASAGIRPRLPKGEHRQRGALPAARISNGAGDRSRKDKRPLEARDHEAAGKEAVRRDSNTATTVGSSPPRTRVMNPKTS